MDGANPEQYVSEYTRKTLQQFEWKHGEPIPENMADVLSAVHARTPESKTPGLYVDIAVMTAEDVALVKQTLAATKEQIAKEKRNAEIDAATAGLDESTRQLYAQLTDKKEEPAQIIDDRVAAALAAPPESTAPAENEKTEEISPAIEAGTAAPVNVLSPVAADICPRCSWDMRQTFDVTITDEDKEFFIAVTLGGERFKKTYTLMGGKYTVRFRSLLAEENTAIHHQLLLDQREEQFLSDTEWFLRFFEYRLACAIEEVEVNGKVTVVNPELAHVAKDPLPNKTDDIKKSAVVRLREWIIVEALKNEITRRLVSNQFRQFQRLCEALEAMALAPNFW